MTQVQFLPLIEPIQQDLAEFQRKAFEDFDRIHGNERLSVEGSRPKWVSLRVMHYLEMKYGSKGAVRVTSNRKKNLKFLMIEGDNFNLVIRPKKCDDHWRSKNHFSQQQEMLRESGKFMKQMLFAEVNKKTFNLVLGWRQSGGLEPTLKDIAIVWERRSRAEMIVMLSNSSDGARPIREVQTDLPDVFPQPKIAPKRKDGKGGESKQG